MCTNLSQYCSFHSLRMPLEDSNVNNNQFPPRAKRKRLNVSLSSLPWTRQAACLIATFRSALCACVTQTCQTRTLCLPLSPSTEAANHVHIRCIRSDPCNKWCSQRDKDKDEKHVGFLRINAFRAFFTETGKKSQARQGHLQCHSFPAEAPDKESFDSCTVLRAPYS